jgi:VIT1/CCC1 family predicted Fe2+/Mn2+ transporter
MTHAEHHRSHRIGWLRASVLGTNDAIVSTATLIIGVSAANRSHDNIALAGFAGLVDGAISMAAGEYVSVSSQKDTDNADLSLERKALKENYQSEVEELSDIYQARGVEASLATQVAKQLMTHDALGAHARDKIGISATTNARPVQAAVSSTAAFSIGAALPLILTLFTTIEWLMPAVAAGSLALLGVLAAKAGGTPVATGAMRVAF